MLINFPAMHAELIPDGLAEGVILFDPGLANDDSERFHPELPFDEKISRALIQDSLSFGEQFKDSAEMAFFGVHTPDDYFDESEGTIKAQLLAGIGAGTVSQGHQKDPHAPLRRAQFVLLLAYETEERLVESVGLENALRTSWSRMSDALGMDESERKTSQLGRVLSNTDPSSSAGFRLSWQRVIESMAAFLPENGALWCDDSEIIEEWKDRNVVFCDISAENLPDDAEFVEAPVWRLSGRTHCPEDLPYVGRTIRVVCRKR